MVESLRIRPISMLGLAFLFALLPGSTHAQLAFSSSSAVAVSEVGLANTSGSGSWNAYAYDHEESDAVGSTTVPSSTSFEGPDTSGFGLDFQGYGSGQLSTTLSAGLLSGSFDTLEGASLLSGSNPYIGPAAYGGVSQDVTMTAGTTGTYQLNASASVVSRLGNSAFSFVGYLEDHTAGWTHPFTVAAADTAFHPYSETDTVSAGDKLELSWYEESYGIGSPTSSEATGSVSLLAPTPEPTTLAVFGIAALGWWKRRR